MMTIMMLTKETCIDASAQTIATDAALIGEAISPLCDAITLIDNGRSGLMSALADTSTITGINA